MSGRPSALGYKFLRKNFPEFPTDYRGRTMAFTGKPNSPIPRDMEGVREVGGITLVLHNGAGPQEPMHHRIKAVCPKCALLIPAGRLHQHVGVCKGM